MNIDEVIEILKLKFTSSNPIPVRRATITREEWEVILDWYRNNPVLSPKESEEFLKKVEDGLKNPVGPVPTPKIDEAIKRFRKEAEKKMKPIRKIRRKKQKELQEFKKGAKK